jgi:outer membrane protein OmpA-like peptidoglycan-associated protein
MRTSFFMSLSLRLSLSSLTTFLLITSLSFSQNPKAKEFYEKGLKEYTERKYTTANDFFLKAIEKDSNYAEPYFKLGQISENQLKESNALKYYQEAINKKPFDMIFTQGYTYLGSRLLKKGEYQKAKEYLSFSLKNTSPTSILYKQLSRQLESCNLSIEAKANEMSFRINPLSDEVNFKNRQYFPVLTADNEYVFFTARPEDGEENIYLSKWTGSEWTKAISISEKINSKLNEGACSISADGKMIVYTSCDRNDTYGSCDLYFSKKVNEEWEAPQNMGNNVNSSFWDSQPSLSNDGKTIYFSSERIGGYGRKDLWMSELQSNGEWSRAINLGKEINTNGDEVTPFIHANNKTIFFASNGHIGMGGLDLFMTEQKGGTYTKPEHLGFPLNNHEDQVALFICSDGKKGYYSVDEKTRTQIYEFEIPKIISDKFKKANFVKGIVLDAVSKAQIEAEIELIDLKTNKIIEKVKSDNKTGEYMAVLPNGSQYALYINKNNYIFKSLTFDYSEKNDADGKRIDILLEQFKKDAKEVLNNIFFDTGKADLKPESFTELNKIIKLLKENPTLKIEISGHTDDIGSDADNQFLSSQRANAVVNFLLKNGINTQNVKAVGYGETKPLVVNNSTENRAINRRIEMKIL